MWWAPAGSTMAVWSSKGGPVAGCSPSEVKVVDRTPKAPKCRQVLGLPGASEFCRGCLVDFVCVRLCLSHLRRRQMGPLVV
eukprot:9765964-Heterocapsa_arctica.AAC.1